MSYRYPRVQPRAQPRVQQPQKQGVGVVDIFLLVLSSSFGVILGAVSYKAFHELWLCAIIYAVYVVSNLFGKDVVTGAIYGLSMGFGFTVGILLSSYVFSFQTMISGIGIELARYFILALPRDLGVFILMFPLYTTAMVVIDSGLLEFFRSSLMPLIVLLRRNIDVMFTIMFVTMSMFIAFHLYIAVSLFLVGVAWIFSMSFSFLQFFIQSIVSSIAGVLFFFFLSRYYPSFLRDVISSIVEAGMFATEIDVDVREEVKRSMFILTGYQILSIALSMLYGVASYYNYYYWIDRYGSYIIFGLIALSLAELSTASLIASLKAYQKRLTARTLIRIFRHSVAGMEILVIASFLANGYIVSIIATSLGDLYRVLSSYVFEAIERFLTGLVA